VLALGVLFLSGCSYVGLGVLAALSPGSSSSAHELMQ
jgi:hypothetical protein